MTLFVLGAEGLLGRHVMRELGGSANGLSRRDCDVADGAAVLAATRGATAIVNCAGWTNVDGAEKNVDDAFRANAIGAENAAIAAETHGAKLVHVSTGFVFDGAQERPYDEHDRANPISAYGRSKWAGEQLVAGRPRVFVVRLQSLYGVGGKNFASTLAERMLRRDPIRLDGARAAQPTWAGAVARQLVALLATDAYGTYHATCAGSTTWAEFGRRVASAIGVEKYWDEVGSEAIGVGAARPSNYLMDRRMLRLRGLDRMPDWSVALDGYLADLAKETKRK